MPQDTGPELVSFHEAGHAVGISVAFRDAAWLPYPPPPVRVRSVEVVESTPGQWTGNCVGTNIYSTAWPESRIAPRYRLLMEAQVSIHLAGGIAEAIHRGERRRREVLAFAKLYCHADADLTLAAGVVADLRRLRRYDEQRLVDRTLAVLLAHWPAVEALASALIENRRIEGDHVEQIIDHSMIGSESAAATEKQQLTAEEADLIKTLERMEGRKLTEQEINLSLDQARAIGEL